MVCGPVLSGSAAESEDGGYNKGTPKIARRLIIRGGSSESLFPTPLWFEWVVRRLRCSEQEFWSGVPYSWRASLLKVRVLKVFELGFPDFESVGAGWSIDVCCMYTLKMKMMWFCEILSLWWISSLYEEVGHINHVRIWVALCLADNMTGPPQQLGWTGCLTT